MNIFFEPGSGVILRYRIHQGTDVGMPEIKRNIFQRTLVRRTAINHSYNKLPQVGKASFKLRQSTIFI